MQRGWFHMHNMIIEDFSIEKDDDDVEFITFPEGPQDKTRWSAREISASYSQNVRYRREELLSLRNS